MTTPEALARIIPELTDELVIHTTGYICRDSCAVKDRPENFYMIGSMGLAASIGLGLAQARPSRRVIVFDGDGALLMGLGTLAMASTMRLANFAHVVFDNEAYASTGHQPTHSREVPLEALARASGYRWVARADSPAVLAEQFRAMRRAAGPTFLLVKCVDRAGAPSSRIPHEPPAITRRLMDAAAA